MAGRIAHLLLAVALAVLAGGCGESDEQDAARTVAEAFIELTQRGDQEAACAMIAHYRCEGIGQGSGLGSLVFPEAARIDSVDVDGNRAIASVVVESFPPDDHPYTSLLYLRLVDGQWWIDQSSL